jgi:precorrin-8X/cobalt-precorrin-8 methylmutase
MAASVAVLFSTLFVGISSPPRLGDSLVTPRGYPADSRSGFQPDPPPGQVGNLTCEGDAILAESFRLIDREVGAHPFDAVEWPIVRRMIHASGDPDLARLVCFRNGGARAGVAAFRDGIPLVADVRMVAAGIRAPWREALGVGLHCFIDHPDVVAQAAGEGSTRSRRAMQRAVAEAGDALYAVGNAPTALAALCEAVRQGRVRPRLILAMPVGFVGVLESKEQALALDVPVVCVRGRKGGSAVTAAAVNALLHLAMEGRP